jgi:hypothetical protein
MKPRIGNIMAVWTLASAMLLNGGCTTGLTTSLVWRIKEYHPAEVPRLTLATCDQKNDVLVQYDECFANSRQPRQRAYWLWEYAGMDTSSQRRPKPAFAEIATLTNLCAVPMVETNEVKPRQGFYAVPAADQRSFELWRDGAALGEYRLPVYFSAPPVTWGRVLLTPVTATTDAAIVTAVIGAFGMSAGLGPGGR